MPIRTIKQKSERGSIRDIQQAVKDNLQEDPNLPPTSTELRIKSLYELALATRDENMIASLGLIVMDGAPNDPVALLRHKEYIKGLSSKLNMEVQAVKQDIEMMIDSDLQKCYTECNEMKKSEYKQEFSRNKILPEDEVIVKNASFGKYLRGATSFWRFQ